MDLQKFLIHKEELIVTGFGERVEGGGWDVVKEVQSEVCNLVGIPPWKSLGISFEQECDISEHRQQYRISM